MRSIFSNCQRLSKNIEKKRDKAVAADIKTLSAQMKSIRTDFDPLGHSENLDNLVRKLNNQCMALEFTVKCYACIYTYPAQSEILVTFPDGLIRVLDISTPENGNLEFLRVH